MSLPPPHKTPPPPLPSSARKGSSSSSAKKWAPVTTTVSIDTNKWSLDPNWTFNRESAKPCDISNIRWNLKGVQCQKDSDNVFFVETENGTLVIKASFTIASDFFASMIANKVGIFAPRMEIFSYLSQNWEPMVQSLWVLEETHKEIDAGRGNKLSKCLMRLFLSIYEFVAGFDLSTLPEIYAPLLTAGSGPLFQLGKIIALDIFLNNWDRIPFGNIWNNEGNSKNIMFQIDSDNRMLVRAIDNSITSITHQENFLTYQDRVKESVLNAERSAKVTRDFILNNTNRIEVGELGEKLIAEGVKTGIKEISNLSISEILKVKEDCEILVQPTLKMLGVEEEHAGVTRINIPFLEGMLHLFASLNEKLF